MSQKLGDLHFNTAINNASITTYADGKKKYSWDDQGKKNCNDMCQPTKTIRVQNDVYLKQESIMSEMCLHLQKQTFETTKSMPT